MKIKDPPTNTLLWYEQFCNGIITDVKYTKTSFCLFNPEWRYLIFDCDRTKSLFFNFITHPMNFFNIHINVKGELFIMDWVTNMSSNPRMWASISGNGSGLRGGFVLNPSMGFHFSESLLYFSPKNKQLDFSELNVILNSNLYKQACISHLNLRGFGLSMFQSSVLPNGRVMISMFRL